uniref:Carboxylic ester hydrolase n=1 Tax=Cnaphalocrocis medinalis TaxID=437488 RepID=A0A0C5C1M2_CNAME|nr:carboxylesterase [Cnaphalocrocis medinalis]
MVQVSTSDGVLEGEVIQDDLVTYNSFKGIPYAAPPVDDLRFKPPQPVQPWQGVRPAKELGSPCYQFDMMLNTVHGSEDCLYLNVYSPDLRPDQPLPVMVWIHGGGFMSGSGNDDLYGPEFLIRQGVILVTFNYRLEVLGFLCLDSEEVPGNVGMKDQVAALKWVQKNIASFGGDPENVTIFGESAGGASVCGHLLSPMSKGLFKRAIAQSGATTCALASPWGAREAAISLARKLGFYSEDSKELYEFFKNQPVENLINSREPFILHDFGRGFAELKFAMTIEKDFGQERFFVGEPYELLRKGVHEGVDVIVGYTEDEGILWAKQIENMDKMFEIVKTYDDFLVPRRILMEASQENKFKVGKRMKEYYFSKTYETYNENVTNFFKYASMDMFVYGIMQWAKICSSAKTNNTYLYKFTCKSERNMMTHFMGLRQYLDDRTVVCHADDLPYLFPLKVSGIKVDQGSETFKLIEQVTKLWTNFAKYGNPTPDNSLGAKWSPYDVDNQKYLDIGNHLVVGYAPEAEELKLWEDTFREFGPKYVF